MLYIKNENTYIPWDYRIGDIRYPDDIEYKWTKEELKALNLYTPLVPEVPKGKVVVNKNIDNLDGVLTYVYELEDEPVPIRKIPKNSIWEKATDEEAIIMRYILGQQSVRIQEIYNGATHLQSDHELFHLIEGALTQAFGVDRANELLAGE
jgi:hypothetical protein